MVKTITIRNEVYDKLAAVKGRDESFSQLFERLLSETSSADLLRKLRGSVEFRDKEKLVSEISRRREERRL